jgi:hypothetical protein
MTRPLTSSVTISVLSVVDLVFPLLNEPQQALAGPALYKIERMALGNGLGSLVASWHTSLIGQNLP